MKFSNRLLLLLLLLSFPLGVLAQRLTAHNGTVPKSYNYWFYIPSEVPLPGSVIVHQHMQDTTLWNDTTIWKDVSEWADSWDLPTDTVVASGKPLVIFLHGASLCGQNLARVRRYGTIDAISKGLKIDAYVMAPQNPGGAWNPAKINRIVDWALKNHDIDSTRIYVLGMSLGGYGTIDYAADSPHRVAAAMALCGGGTSKTLGKLNEVPLAILHGTGDKAVPWTASQSVVNAMLAAGDTTRLVYRLLPKQSHGALARYFYVPAVYEWLFEHSLSDYKRPVNREYSFGIEVTDNCFRKLDKPTTPLTVVGATRNVATSDAVDNTSNSGVHIVRKGDNLGKIAKKYRTSIAHLCKVNGINRNSTLRIGQKIRY